MNTSQAHKGPRAMPDQKWSARDVIHEGEGLHVQQSYHRHAYCEFPVPPQQEAGPVCNICGLPGNVMLMRLRGASGPSASGRGLFLKLILGLSFCEAWLVRSSAGWLRLGVNVSVARAGIGGLAQDCLIFRPLGRFAGGSAWPAHAGAQVML